MFNSFNSTHPDFYPKHSSLYGIRLKGLHVRSYYHSGHPVLKPDSSLAHLSSLPRQIHSFASCFYFPLSQQVLPGYFERARYYRSVLNALFHFTSLATLRGWIVFRCTHGESDSVRSEDLPKVKNLRSKGAGLKLGSFRLNITHLRSRFKLLSLALERPLPSMSIVPFSSPMCFLTPVPELTHFPLLEKSTFAIFLCPLLPSYRSVLFSQNSCIRSSYLTLFSGS